LFVGVLLWLVDVRQLVQTVLDVNLVSLLLGACLYAANNVLRAARFKILTLSRQASLGRMFLIVSALSLFNQLLPLRSGELTYIYLAKKGQDIEPRESLASLIFARMLDLLMISCFFLVSVPILVRDRSMESASGLLISMAFLVLMLVLVLWGLARYGSSIASFLGSRLGGRNGGVRKLLGRFLQFFTQVLEILHMYRSWRLLGLSALLSVGVWLCTFGMSVVLVSGLGYEIHAAAVLLAAVVGAFTSVLPINSIGNWGTLELGWSGALILQGFPVEEAVASGIGVHFIAFLYTVVFGLVGLAGVHWLPGPLQPARTPS
jgi:uncharacterized protein (TIRG00374 family)